MSRKKDSKVADLVAQLAAAKGHEQRSLLRAQLRSRGPDIATQLTGFLDHPDNFLRWELVSLLGEFAHPQTALDMVEFALHEDEVHARWRSFWAVCRFDRSITLPVLIAALKKPESQKAWRAAMVLSMLDRSEAIPIITRRLYDSDEWIRWEAVSAVKALAPPGLADKVGQLLVKQQPRSIRQEAALALGNLPDRSTVDWLAKALGDHHPEVRWRAAMSLSKKHGSAALRVLRKRQAMESEQRVLKEIQLATHRLEHSHAH